MILHLICSSACDMVRGPKLCPNVLFPPRGSDPPPQSDAGCLLTAGSRKQESTPPSRTRSTPRTLLTATSTHRTQGRLIQPAHLRRLLLTRLPVNPHPHLPSNPLTNPPDHRLHLSKRDSNSNYSKSPTEFEWISPCFLEHCTSTLN